MSHREDFIAGLRSAAEFFEEHPDFNTPHDVTLNSQTDEKERFLHLARQMGHTTKDGAGSFYWLQKDFGGGVHLDLFTSRDKICKAVIVGKRVLPAEPEKPEREEDVIEWQCDESIFAGKEAQ